MSKIEPLKELSEELNQARSLAMILKDLLKALPESDRGHLRGIEFKRSMLIRSLFIFVGRCNEIAAKLKNT